MRICRGILLRPVALALVGQYGSDAEVIVVPLTAEYAAVGDVVARQVQ